MTVVEQLIAIREDVCRYACKYKEDIEFEYPDPLVQKVMIQQFCQGCPMTKIHYEGEKGLNSVE